MFALHFKRLWKNRVTLCMAIFILVLVIVPTYIIGFDEILKIEDGPSLMVRGMISIVPYLFFGFLFLSYELFYGWNKSHIQETIAGGTKNKLWDKVSCALIILLLDAVACLFIFGGCLVSYYKFHLHSQSFLIYQFRAIFIYQFLCSALAVVIGWVASRIQKRIWGMTFILLTAYLFDGGFIELIMNIDDKNRNIWNFCLLFSIYNRFAAAMEEAHYLLTAENVNMFRCMFWIFFFISVGMIIRKRAKRYIIVPCILTVAMLLMYVKPSGAIYILPYISNGFDSWMYPQIYYGEDGRKSTVDYNRYIEESRDDFSIKEYDMQIKVDDIIKAKVCINPDKTNLSEYQFTLYNEYKIDKITDEKGNPLEYKRDGDYLAVYNTSKKIDNIIIEYFGASQWYYATSQGMFLAANFPYYPKAGWKRVFMDSSKANTYMESSTFWPELPKEKSKFNVNLYIKSKFNVFSNIERQNGTERKDGYSHYEFKGETDGITLMGNPYLKEKEILGVRMIYSELDKMQAPIGGIENEYKKQFAELEKNGCSLRGKTFFVYSIGQYPAECMGSDQYIGAQYRCDEQAQNYKKYGIIYKEISDEEAEEQQKDIDEFLKEQKQLFEEENRDE